jgi:photosystem II stability/assembly factor-like uncharacterized protein
MELSFYVFMRIGLFMKKLSIIIFLSLVLYSCEKNIKLRHISKVDIEDIFKDSLLSIRAIDLYENEILKFACNNRIFGDIYLRSSDWVISQVRSDTLNLEFRSIGNSFSNYYFMSIGSPAKIFNNYKELVYRETHPKAFYDSMDFWNDNEGIAIGDSTNGCLSVIITRDGGNTWTKLSCDDLPEGIENEGAFAASDTNIAIVGSKTWVATTAGRVYYSPDKGKTWDVFDTPIIKEQETEGIYSIDFFDKLNGFAIGGDYTKPENNAANKIRTQDGGKTWNLVAENKGPGYRSCVQYIPNRLGKELVAIGFKGIDYSNDSGESWKHLSDEGFYTIRFLNDSVAYAAGKGRISKLTFRE